MKILVVAHRAPFPPDSGSKIRSFNMIRYLAGAGHEITVASLARGEDEYRKVEGLRDYCQELIIEAAGETASKLRMIARLPTPVPSSMGYFYSPRLHRRIAGATRARDFDFIVVHSSSVAQYVVHCKDTPKLIDFCDMDSQKWLTYAGWKPFPLSLGYWLEGTKLERAEKRLAAQFDVATVATPAELESLDALGTARATGWFANGVDSEFFARSQPYDAAGPVCFVGRMDYYPNAQAMLKFCADSWPALRAALGDIELTIVGAAPPASVRELGKLPGVTVTGFVEDVRPWLEQASMAIAPLQIARGTQNKVLEAMAMELPVIASAMAAAGVDARPGEHLEAVDSPDELEQAIIALRQDPGRARQLGAAARERVLQRHDWQTSMSKMHDIVVAHAGKTVDVGA